MNPSTNLEERLSAVEQLLRSHQHTGIGTDQLRNQDLQQVGRTVLAVAATSISVSVPPKHFLRILISFGAKSGTSDDYLRFNADSGNNYTTTTGVSQGQIDIRNGLNSALGAFSVIDVAANLSNLVKPAFIHTVNRITSAATAISSAALFAAWVNTAAFITTISLTSSGVATYPVGTEILILSSKE